MNTYKVNFHFASDLPVCSVTMYDRSEDLEGMCIHLTKAAYQSFIEPDKAVVVNLANVTRIEIMKER